MSPAESMAAGGHPPNNLPNMSRHSIIDKSCWAAFCDAYSRQHQGWIACVETIEPGLDPPAVALVVHLPLQGVVLQDRQPVPELLVCLGVGEQLFTHRIIRPAQIAALQTESGLDEGLQIRDEGGGLYRIRFRAPASPETLDGVAAV